MIHTWTWSGRLVVAYIMDLHPICICPWPADLHVQYTTYLPTYSPIYTATYILTLPPTPYHSIQPTTLSPSTESLSDSLNFQPLRFPKQSKPNHAPQRYPSSHIPRPRSLYPLHPFWRSRKFPPSPTLSPLNPHRLITTPTQKGLTPTIPLRKTVCKHLILLLALQRRNIQIWASPQPLSELLGLWNRHTEE